MDERQALRVQETPCRKRVERALEQRGVPAVEQIAADDEMVSLSRNDAVELAAELDHIVFISQMEI